jgi:predicted transcriptional regulator
MDANQPKINFSVRLDPLLRDRLEAAALADRRPLTALIRNVLEDYAAWRSGQQARAA